MAGYIPWYGKKREHLMEHEREFVALLQSGADSLKVAEGAEEVRALQVRALKSTRAELPPSERNATAVANLEREIAFWLALSVEEIIDGYRTLKLKGYRARAVRRATR